MITLSPKELALLAINGFSAMQKQDELARLIRAASSIYHKTILEIGSGKGGTTWAWSKLCSNLIVVDLPNGPWGGGPTSEAINYINENSSGELIFFAGSSQDKAIFAEASRFAPIDFLFIDGDHSYQGVRADYELYSPLVRPGGLIAFHDTCEHSKESGCEVKRFWDEIKVGKKYEEFISEPTNWGGIGLIYVP